MIENDMRAAGECIEMWKIETSEDLGKR